jgi:hypothetical protein
MLRIEVFGKTDMTFLNLQSTSATGVPSVSINGGKRLVFRGCVFDGASKNANAVSILDAEPVWAEDILFDDCIAKNSGVPASESNQNINITEGCRNITVQNCTIFGAEENNLQVFGRDPDPTPAPELAPSGIRFLYNTIYGSTFAHGIEIGWTVTDSEVTGNTIYSNAKSAIAVIDETDSITVQNNVCYDNKTGALAAGTVDLSMINNTFVMDNDAAGFGVELRGAQTRMVLKNNIVVGQNGVRPKLQIPAESVGGVDSNNNCFYDETDSAAGADFTWNGNSYDDLASYQAASGLDSNSIWADPKFVDAANDDYRLGSDSPCLGIGSDMGGP